MIVGEDENALAAAWRRRVVGVLAGFAKVLAQARGPVFQRGVARPLQAAVAEARFPSIGSVLCVEIAQEPDV